VKVVADGAAVDVFDLGKTKRLSYLLVLRNDAFEEEVESLLCVTAVAKGSNDEFEGAGQ
jgi:hypothetical protein